MSSTPHLGVLSGTSVADVVPLSLLADEDCRAVLRILPSLPQPVSERTLAVHVTAVTRNRTLGDVPTAERESVQLSMHHRELPKLEQAGVINHDPETREVSLVERFDLDESVYDEVETAVDTGTWDAFTAVRTHAHRMRIVEELAECDGGISRMDLARSLHETEMATDGGQRDSADPELEIIETRLHHADLPRLADAGVLTYDPETAWVEPADEALLDELTS